jgi:epoxyqueuosine reductase
MASLKQRIFDKAKELGFSAWGIARADAAPEAGERLKAWIAAGNHGEMGWMEERAAQRASPQGLWPDARSVIALAMSYAPPHDPLALEGARDRGRISVYAQGADYHKVVKKALKAMGRWLAEEAGCELKVFVDTAPVMEKPLSAAAGIGWQGKHTNLVSREFGSWLFLGSIFTTLQLVPDQAEQDHCGSCHACLDICPTRAFPAPYRIDARRCISYLTIEHKGHIAREFREAIGNRVYGCDDCLAVCPWNKFAQTAREVAFHPRIELTLPLLGELATLDDASLREFFSGSPIKRIGRDRFLRNVLIAIGNSGDSNLARVAEQRLSDASPLVRAMAVWALSKLLPREAFERLASEHAPNEGDAAVAAEWRPATEHA